MVGISIQTNTRSDRGPQKDHSNSRATGHDQPRELQRKGRNRDGGGIVTKEVKSLFDEREITDGTIDEVSFKFDIVSGR